MRERAMIALVVAAIASQALATETPTSFQGIRPLGMGGAFTAVADDENALFYNPAGLDKAKRFGLGLVNPWAALDEEGISLAQDAKDMNFGSAKEVTALLRDHAGETSHVRAGLFPYLYTRGFALGALGQANVRLQPFDSRLDPLDSHPRQMVRVDASGSTSAHVGLGLGIVGSLVRVGVAAKYAHGYRLSEVYSVEDIIDDDFVDEVRDDLEQGSGVGFDVGAMIELPLPLRPTLAAAVINVNDLDLGAAGRVPRQVNLGAALSQSFAGLRLTAAADYRDAPDDPQVLRQTLEHDLRQSNASERLHLGIEARFPSVLTVRAGLSEGLPSYGASLRLAILHFDYAARNRQIGAGEDVQDDWEHVGQVSLGW